MKGEQNLEEMIEVLTHLHQYVPTVSEEVVEEVGDEPVKMMKDTFFPTLIGKAKCSLQLIVYIKKPYY